MNNCEKFRNMICNYVDGELSESEQALLFEHIKLCHECKTELDMMKKTMECLKNMPIVPLPEGFNEAFRQNLTKDEEKETKEKVVPFYRKWRTYTSVAAVILFVFVLKSGLTDKNVLLTDDAQPKQNITSQAKLSIGADNTQALDTTQAQPAQNERADVMQNKPEPTEPDFAAESVPEVAVQPRNDTVISLPLPEVAEDMSESVPEIASETNENGGIAASSETDEALPQVRASGGGSAGGGGGGSSSVVYKSVYRATDNAATVFVGEGDAPLASALFDIMLYTPAEIESILTRNGITDFSIKTPIGDFESYYVKVEIK